MEEETFINKEYKRLQKLRNINTLKKIPLIKWKKDEILDFLEHYIIYFEKNRESVNLLSMEEFLRFGEYRKYYDDNIEKIKKQ